jgi:beta-glucosidase
MKRPCLSLLLTLILFATGSYSGSLYRDPSKPIDERVEDLLKLMTLDEKMALLTGDSTGFDTKVIPRLGIPALHMTDGPVGVRYGLATAFPSGVATAATWDTALIRELAQAMAVETKAKGRNYLLGPCVCIQRFPLGGRNFESYSEDPFLASRLAVSWVQGLQSEKVICAVKHFATNDQEWERNNYDVRIDERTLREVHLAPFEAAVKDGRAWSVMAAYNLQNGQHCTENYHLIKDILKGEWGFKGFLISDWSSVYSTVEAANAGLDLEMPSGIFFPVDSLKKYMGTGAITEETITDKVRRLMRAAFWAGLFENQPVADSTVFLSARHQSLALRSAQEAITLLKNDGNALPLQTGTLKCIALVGPNAAKVPTGGGGSSFVSPIHAVSPLEGFKKRLGDSVIVLYATGDTMINPQCIPINPAFLSSPDKKQKGLLGEYFVNKNLLGSPVVTRLDREVNFDFGSKSPSPLIADNSYSARWTGWITVDSSAAYYITCRSDDGARMYLDDSLVIDDWTNHGAKINHCTTALTAGRSYKIRLEYYEDGGAAIVQLGLERVKELAQDYCAKAVQVAAKADVTVLFLGAYPEIESEGADRESLRLPGRQEELLDAVAAVTKNIVVVLNGGTPVQTSRWIGKVKALATMYYIGQETGHAIASVVMGDCNPCGRLPFSFIDDTTQSPAFSTYKNPGLKIDYSEGVFVGYRYLDKNNTTPAYPFGFGLSYTHCTYSDLRVKPHGGNTYAVSFNITNSGKRDGAEVAQLYLSDKKCSVPRPVKELKGFTRAQLKAGETRKMTIMLQPRDFAFWDVSGKGWKIEPGDFEVMVGSSSRDLPLKGSIALTSSRL